MRQTSQWRRGFLIGIIGAVVLFAHLASAQPSLPGGSAPPGVNALPQDSLPEAEEDEQIARIPFISHFNPACLGPGTLSLHGGNFGSQKGKAVKLNGKGVSASYWSDKKISVSIKPGNYSEKSSHSVEIFVGADRKVQRSLKGCPQEPKTTASPRSPGKIKEASSRASNRNEEPGIAALAGIDLAVRVQINRGTGKGDMNAEVTATNLGNRAVKAYTIAVWLSQSGRLSPDTGVGNAAKQIKSPIALSPKTSRRHTFVLTLNPSRPYVCARILSRDKDIRPHNNVACRLVNLSTPIVSGSPPPEPPTAMEQASNEGGVFGAALRKGSAVGGERRVSPLGSRPVIPKPAPGRGSAQPTMGHVPPGALADVPGNEAARQVRGSNTRLSDQAVAASILLPDLIVTDIQLSRDPSGGAGQILMRFEDNNERRPFREWYERREQELREAGLPTDLELIYPFDFEVFVDGSLVPQASGGTYLPPSGRKHVITDRYHLPADGRAHQVTVAVKPPPDQDRDPWNNHMIRDLQAEPVRVRVAVYAIERMQVVYDGDGGGAGELEAVRAIVKAVDESGAAAGQFIGSDRNEEYDLRVASFRNLTTRTLHGGRVESIPINDGDLLGVEFETLYIDTINNKHVIIDFQGYEDDCPGWAPCKKWGSYRIRHPELWRVPLRDHCTPGVNVLNLADMAQDRLVLPRDEPDDVKIRPVSGQICVTRIQE